VEPRGLTRPSRHHPRVSQTPRCRRPGKAQEVEAHDPRRRVVEGFIEELALRHHLRSRYNDLLQEVDAIAKGWNW